MNEKLKSIVDCARRAKTDNLAAAKLLYQFSLLTNWQISIVLIVLLFTSFNCNQTGNTAVETSRNSSETITIALIPKGTTHEFWKSIHAGGVKAAREAEAAGTKVELIWKGPLREDDREQQIQVVEGFISQNVKGIVLAPLDNRALVRPVEEAARAGVPTVVIDSGLETNQIKSFVATDNRKGGELAADALGEALKGAGKILVLRYAEGSKSTTEREEGFLAQIKAKYPNITVVSSDQYSGATRDTAKRASENLLNRFGADLDGIFTPNESATAGMLLALEDINRAGKVAFVGFDSSQTFVEAMRAGKLNGIVVQNPMKMGYLGVKTMLDAIAGKPVENRVDTGVIIVTPANLEITEVKELLNPPLDQYLN